MTKQHYESYKETGNPWLGKVPSDWQVRRADFVIKSRKLQISPSDLESRDVYHYAIPTVQATGAGTVEEGESIDSGKLIINEPQVLVSKLNPRKATVTIAEPHPDYLTVASTEFVPIIPWEADLNYMFYVWKSQKVTDRLSSFVQSVTRSHQRCDPAEITKITWAWPSEGKQQKIAAFLDRKTAEIDTLIAKKRRLLERLAEKRTALITRAVTKGLNPDAPMKDSGIEWLGEIPAHWGVSRVKFFAAVGNGSTPSRENADYWVGGDYPWLNSGVVNKASVTEADQFVTKSALRECHLPIIDPPAILLGITGQGKTRGMATKLEIQATINQHLVFVKPDERVFDIDYLYAIFERAYLYLRSESDGGGSTKGAITCGQVENLCVPLPPVSEQREIALALQEGQVELHGVSRKIGKAIDRLEEYRSALITNAVTGQIKVA
ncbi:restriction endonuclease subunit S [Thioalkalivibrio versutus]|uniref:restriction endonuclease subunit S n=1 Tax=Thioalkalivibrio versutus TaxID=106634 RepID=UPI0009E1CE8F|nr:restriction endonuclease subunit S [Thioalkalivibrio versutus]